MDMVERTHAQASGLHKITYVIGADADDPQTIAAANILRTNVPGVESFCTVRLGSLGQMVNVMAAKYPADVYCSLCDDVEIKTPGWDEVISRHWKKKPDGLWWWRTREDRPATYAIVSHKWYEAAGGRIFTDYFPFWWDDVWLAQLWYMATGDHLWAANVWLEDKPFGTHRMRDLRFWADFYNSRRRERFEQANAIVSKLGWPINEKAWETELGDLRDQFMRDCDKVQERQGDRRPPTSEYLKAKARAERMMCPP